MNQQIDLKHIIRAWLVGVYQDVAEVDEIVRDGEWGVGDGVWDKEVSRDVRLS
jgi:hypothetical protein